jgi:hypothetical protein
MVEARGLFDWQLLFATSAGRRARTNARVAVDAFADVT